MLPKDIFEKHSHIWLDLDETLAATTAHMLWELHSMKKFLSIKDMHWLTDFEWYNLPGCDMSMEELIIYWKSHLITDCLPIPDAVEWTRKLQNLWKNLSIITARNKVNHKVDVLEWCSRYYQNINSHSIYFANHIGDTEKVPKSEFCKIHGITLMIDDAIGNIEDFIDNWITAILIEKPWNRSYSKMHPLLYRIKDWSEILAILN